MNRDNVDPKAVSELMAAYQPRIVLLKELAKRLEDCTRQALYGIPRIDRIGFRDKDSTSFAHKSLKTEKDGTLRYARPLQDIEDQVAGRILVFFRRDIDPVATKRP